MSEMAIAEKNANTQQTPQIEVFYTKYMLWLLKMYTYIDKGVFAAIYYYYYYYNTQDTTQTIEDDTNNTQQTNTQQDTTQTIEDDTNNTQQTNTQQDTTQTEDTVLETTVDETQENTEDMVVDAQGWYFINLLVFVSPTDQV